MHCSHGPVPNLLHSDRELKVFNLICLIFLFIELILLFLLKSEHASPVSIFARPLTQHSVNSQVPCILKIVNVVFMLLLLKVRMQGYFFQKVSPGFVFAL